MSLFTCFKACAAAFALSSVAIAKPLRSLEDRSYNVVKEGIKYNVFEHRATGARMEYVNNSGICETTPGVNQYSGYLSVGTNMNMWFWFFEARNNASTAPLVTWFNGGPGCSSMIGLFQENGPCQFYNGSSSPSLNPYSWNEYANMLYVDQPIGTGFSYGTGDVDSAETAAPYVWNLLQAFYAQFPQYESRDFGLFTESYGGMYGPAFTSYFQEQNSAGAGEPINLVALGINNGWMDSTTAYQAQIDFLYNNTHRQIISQSQYDRYTSTYESDCLPLLQQCQSSGMDDDCASAQSMCANAIEGPLQSAGDFNVYDVRESRNGGNPPETYVDYLASSAVMSKIGANSPYTECSDPAYYRFAETGDDSKTYIPELERVVNSGVQTLIWAGDADWICNWMGVLTAADTLSFEQQDEFRSAELEPYTMHGQHVGDFKTAGNLSFLKVFNAGHEVPYYTPELALQVFVQTMQKKAIYST